MPRSVSSVLTVYRWFYARGLPLRGDISDATDPAEGCPARQYRARASFEGRATILPSVSV